MNENGDEVMFGPLTFTTLFAAVLSPVAVLGHHSRAAYDTTQEVVFEGTVTSLDWKNPHILITLETRGANGASVLQEIEVAGVTHVRALGLPKDAVAPGAQVVVRARPSRRGAGARALGLEMTTAEGAVYPLGNDLGLLVRPSSAVRAEGLAGRWAPTIESFNETFRVGQTMPLTAAGRAASDETMRTVQSPGVSAVGICEPFPPLVLSHDLGLRTIDVSDASVVMSFDAEGMDQRRVVHLDQVTHPRDVSPSVLGHSIGRWEGDTLVIDTVAISPHRLGLFVLPSTPGTHLVERLELMGDRRQLEYTVTIEDRTHLERPFTHTMIWDYRPDLEPSGEACDPDNAQRALEE